MGVLREWRRNTPPLLALVALSTGGVFVLDSITPVEYDVWLLYAIAVLLTVWVERHRLAYEVAAVCTLLVAAASFLAPRDVSPVAVIFNRALGVGMLWALAALLERRKRAEGARRAEEARLEAVFAALPGAVIEYDAELRPVRVNQAAFDAVGLDALRLGRDRVVARLGLRYLDGRVVSTEDLPSSRALRGEEVADDQYVITTADGRERIISASAVALRRGEAATGVVVLWHDVTPLKEAEESLRESEARLRLFIEQAPAAIAMFDTEMRYLAYSRRWLTDYGLQGQDLHGRSHYEVFPEIPERWKEVHQRSLAGSVEQAKEDPFVRADGRVQWLRWEVRPWHLASGAVGGIVIFSEDITARKQAEEDVRLSEEKFAGAFHENVAAVSISRLRDSALIDANERWLELFGFRREEVIGKVVFEETWQNPAERTEMARDLERDGFFRDREVQFRRTTGEAWTGLASARLTTLGGERVLVASAIDITARKHAEAALRESEERLRLAQEAGRIGSFDRDLERGTSVWSDELLAIYGMRREEFSGRYEDWLAHVLPEDRAAAAKAFTRALETGELSGEFRIRRLDTGQVRWVYVRGNTHFGASGKPVRLVGINLDITERKRAEEQEQQLETAERQRAFLASFIDNAPIPLAYVDTDLRFLRVNHRYAEWVGLPVEQIAGRTYLEVWGPQERLEAIHRALLTGEPVQDRETTVAYPAEAGRPEGCADSAAVPVRDATGQVVGLVLSGEDVTERVRAREQLAVAAQEQARQAQLLETIFDNVQSAIGYLDRDLRYMHVNPMHAQVTGRARAEVLGRSIFDFVTDEDARELLRRARDTGQTLQLEEFPYRFTGRPEAGVAYLNAVLAPIRDEQGQFSGMVVALVDVTGQVQTRERVVATERARAELAENLGREIAHRTKNNLAMATGLLELQLHQQADPETKRVIAVTVSRLLAFTSIQEELQTKPDEWVDLLAVLRRVGASSVGTPTAARLTVSVDGESVALPPKAASNLAIAANELLTNAIKHGAPDPDGTLRVEVTLQPEGGLLRLCVWNTGNPVPGDLDPRAQTGLGLRLVSDLATTGYGGTFRLKPARGGTLAEVIAPLEALRQE